ncbi:MAG: helix-turn-helix transcriptional regulator [Clostridia bacterium]|nr:helix-turn-helix transcriptional regulator [Clostridia bacterium]
MRLKDLREDNDVTQKELSEHLHIKQNTYSQYENGQRQVPIDILISLAKYYNTSLDYLVGITNVKKAYPKK